MRIDAFRSLVASATDLVALVAGERYVHVNPAGCRMLRFEEDDLIGRSMWERLDPRCWVMVEERLSRIASESSVGATQLTLRTGDDDAIAVEATAMPVTIEGEPVVATTARVVSGAPPAPAARERRPRIPLEEIAGPVMQLDSRGLINWANAPAASRLGVETSALQKQMLSDFFEPDQTVPSDSRTGDPQGRLVRGRLTPTARSEEPVDLVFWNLADAQTLVRIVEFDARSGRGAAARLQLDPQWRSARIGARTVQLTETEFRVLAELQSKQGLHASGDLLERVWSDADRANTGLLRNVIARLRRKLEIDPSRPRYILTVPRMGYTLISQPGLGDAPVPIVESELVNPVGLPKAERTVLSRRLLLGHSVHAIARDLNLTPAEVRELQLRGLESMLSKRGARSEPW